MQRSVFSSILIVALIASSGAAYAAFTSVANINVSANAGTLILTISVGSGHLTGPYYITVTNLQGNGTSMVSFDVGPFAPGDSITIPISINNAGTLPASGIHLSSSSSNTCDTDFSASSPVTPNSLPAGSSFLSSFTISLLPGLDNTQETCQFTLMFTVSGSAGS